MPTIETTTEAAAAESHTAVWALTLEEFEATKARAAAINARAAKRGFTGRLEVSGQIREIAETDEAGLSRNRIIVDTTITGEAPRYNGWDFLAAVDTIESEDGHAFVLRTAPGVEATDVDRSLLAPGRCEHCSTVRANRRYTYLVRNTETGATAQVGSTCVKDFTGWVGRPVFISVDELEDDLRDFLGGFRSQGPEYSPATVVAVAWAVSRRHGWVPASAAYRAPSTRSLVGSYLYGTSKADKELRRELADEISAASAMAETIIATLLEGLGDDSDYAANLKVCLQAQHVDHRHIGIVSSAVAAYERLIGARVKAEADTRKRQESRYVGSLGDKITVTGTVTRLKPVTSEFGYRTTTSMLVVVEDGPTIATMFTAAAWAWDVEQGDTITVAGTVKAHEEYRGARQTVLTRPKRLDAPTHEGEESGDG